MKIFGLLFLALMALVIPHAVMAADANSSVNSSVTGLAAKMSGQTPQSITAPPSSNPSGASAPAAPQASTVPTVPPSPPKDDAELQRRLALAKKINEIQPAQEQVWAAIDQVAQSQPAAERASFVTAMRSILNYKAIEKISLDAMADTYTEAELQAMYDYYSKPEAKSAAIKEKTYTDKVYPEVTRMLDQAMMRVRTGGDTSAPSAGGVNPQSLPPQ